MNGVGVCLSAAEAEAFYPRHDLRSKFAEMKRGDRFAPLAPLPGRQVFVVITCGLVPIPHSFVTKLKSSLLPLRCP